MEREGIQMKWDKFIPQFLSQQWSYWTQKFEAALVSFTPPYISKQNKFFSPLIALVALIAAIFLLGLAVGSFFTLFTSLLVLYFILTKVFGIRLDMMGDVVAV